MAHGPRWIACVSMAILMLMPPMILQPSEAGTSLVQGNMEFQNGTKLNASVTPMGMGPALNGTFLGNWFWFRHFDLLPGR